MQSSSPHARREFKRLAASFLQSIVGLFAAAGAFQNPYRDKRSGSGRVDRKMAANVVQDGSQCRNCLAIELGHLGLQTFYFRSRPPDYSVRWHTQRKKMFRGNFLRFAERFRTAKIFLAGARTKERKRR